MVQMKSGSVWYETEMSEWVLFHDLLHVILVIVIVIIVIHRCIRVRWLRRIQLRHALRLDLRKKRERESQLIATHRDDGRTYPVSFEARHKLPSAIKLPTAMQSRDLGQHLLQIRLRLLRLFPQKLDRPLLALAKERKKRIEQLVAGHARHALVLALCRLGLCAL